MDAIDEEFQVSFCLCFNACSAQGPTECCEREHVRMRWRVVSMQHSLQQHSARCLPAYTQSHVQRHKAMAVHTLRRSSHCGLCPMQLPAVQV